MRQREELVYRRANELAASGLHINPITVMTALVQEGFPEAAELLNNHIIRADLRDACAANWRGVTRCDDQLTVTLAADDSEPSQLP